PAKASDTIHFVSGGDCGVNSHTVANNVQAARQDPMFAVVGGDLGYDNGRSVEISLAFLRNYNKHMVGRDGRLIPMLACIGNHEVDGGYNKPRAKAPFFYALFDGLFTDTRLNARSRCSTASPATTASSTSATAPGADCARRTSPTSWPTSQPPAGTITYR